MMVSLALILESNMKEKLESTLTWLQERLSLDDKSISKLVQSYPQVFGLSVKNNIEPKLTWLQERLDMDDKSISKLIKKVPQILGYSVEANLEPNLAWLQERLVLDDASLSFVVQRSPSLFTYNIERNLEPTIKFYEECVGLEAARRCITNSPRLWGASLENRLKPRLAEAQEAGIPIDTAANYRMAGYTEFAWSNSMIFQKTKLLKEKLRDR